MSSSPFPSGSGSPGPSGGAGAVPAADPLQLLTQALSAPTPDQQSVLLEATKSALELHYPEKITIIVGYVLPFVGNGEGVLGSWMVELLELGICRSNLTPDQKTQLCLQSLECLASLLDSTISSPTSNRVFNYIQKMIIQIFASAYPLVFRYLCTNRTSHQLYNILATVKSKILGLVDPSIGVPPPVGKATSKGSKVAGVKVIQRVIMVQSRGSSDPRLQNVKLDPSIALCPTDHPFISVSDLEQEGMKLLEFVLRGMYSLVDADTLQALFSIVPAIIRVRPSLNFVLVSALTGWTPAALTTANSSRSTVRDVEKCLRIILNREERQSQKSEEKAQLQESLAKQAVRMDLAAREAFEENRQKRLAQLEESNESAVKRIKLDPSSSAAGTPPPGPAGFDVNSLPHPLVVELVISNLEGLPQERIRDACSKFQGAEAILSEPGVREGIDAVYRSGPAAMIKAEPDLNGGWGQRAKLEPVDIAMNDRELDVDEEFEEYEDDEEMELDANEIDRRLREQGQNLLPAEIESAIKADPLKEEEEGTVESKPSASFKIANFQLPSPTEPSPAERKEILTKALRRIWLGASAASISASEEDSLMMHQPKELWMLLLARILTRGREREDMSEDQDDVRNAMMKFVLDDFPGRSKFATLWLNEEWFSDHVVAQDGDLRTRTYRNTLLEFMKASISTLDDVILNKFLLTIPEIPSEVILLIQTMCTDEDRVRGRIGLRVLRDLAINRPPIREECVGYMLELCTHPDLATRNPAIAQVRLWVPDTKPMGPMVQQFALRLLKQMKMIEEKKEESSEDAGMEVPEEVEDEEERVISRYLPPVVFAPVPQDTVQQHVELLFALTKKVPEFLNNIFDEYPRLHPSIQEAFQQLLTPLIRSLGASNGKLLTLLRTFPPGAETLALRVLNILTEPKEGGEKVKVSGALVALVKSLVAERTLDPRFVIPIIGELDKTDTRRFLPRIVAMLNGKPSEKEVVKNIFLQILTPRSIVPGSKVKLTEQLTPAELMVSLHENEKEPGLKSTMEAIDICFSITDLFRSEVLGNVMQQIVELPTIPVLFLRTVLNSVNLYKSLIGFIATTLLSRLITKKIWTTPQLWDGFIRCAKKLGVSSYGALLQLPREQLKEIAEKHPPLKAGLRDHVLKKAAGNTSRLPAWFNDVFGENVADSLTVDGEGDMQVDSIPITAVSTPPPITL